MSRGPRPPGPAHHRCWAARRPLPPGHAQGPMGRPPEDRNHLEPEALPAADRCGSYGGRPGSSGDSCQRSDMSRPRHSQTRRWASSISRSTFAGSRLTNFDERSASIDSNRRRSRSSDSNTAGRVDMRAFSHGQPSCLAAPDRPLFDLGFGVPQQGAERLSRIGHPLT